MNNLLALFASILIIYGCNHSKSITIGKQHLNAQLIHSDNFDEGLENWTVEQRPGGTTTIVHEKMDIDDFSGCTVWFNQKLNGSILIEYDVCAISKGGKNDRVSDINCFWMATDFYNPNDLFLNSKDRAGVFAKYHDMQLYYVGMGGHENTKTRFRRYAGGGERPCLPEHDLDAPEFMIKANIVYKIRLIAKGNQIQYYRNNQLIFNYLDNKPYTQGHFGFRTFKNHMIIDNFKVYQLTD